MMRTFSLIAGALLLILAACSHPKPNGNTWGDTGDGRYLNPVLAADYSDPDAIRVGDKYYMVASDFHFLGMQVLESDDLVNWRLISQIYDRFDLPGWDGNQHYSGGSWAPAIRWHDGKFRVYFCTPEEGLFMSTAENPAGPWEPLHCVKAIPRWEDPCPFWDEDGQAYLGHSLKGAGPIILHRMSPDGKELLDEGVTIYTGPTAEGTKIHKWNGMYYLSIPEGGVGPGWQTVLRSESIYGPYERKIVLQTGMTGINGPHQGAIVDTPDGQWWFFHFQRLEALGRVVHLQPMYWADGWPVIGVDQDRNGIGEPVYCWKMPVAGTTPSKPAASDDFDAPELGLQWQFNHNPVNSAWSLSEKPGRLTLHALRAESFRKAKNSLTQKLMGYTGEVTVKMELASLAEGQRCGLAVICQRDQLIGIRKVDGKTELFREEAGKEAETLPFSGRKVWFRLSYDVKADDFVLSYSSDKKEFTPVGASFQPRFSSWKGARPALFCYNTEADEGTVCFDNFEYVFD